MSIISPASSRWSRGAKPNCGYGADDSRRSRPRGPARPSGRAGSAAAPARPAARASTSASSRLELLHPRRDLAHRRDPSARVLARALGRRDAPRWPSFCSARRPSSSGAARGRRASSSITRSSRPPPILAAPRERRANAVGVLADQPEVEHRRTAAARPDSARTRALDSAMATALRRLQPGVLREELGDFLRVVADDDVLGHDRAARSRRCGSRRAPVRTFSLRKLKFGPFVAHAVLDAVAEPSAPTTDERVAARAVVAEQHRAPVVRAGSWD